uniref:Uncharacterized protein n=1 Tax=Anguilla anguilla TaxID=7936 RepID=A0A0E9WMQ9_ANGAN
MSVSVGLNSCLNDVQLLFLFNQCAFSNYRSYGPRHILIADKPRSSITAVNWRMERTVHSPSSGPFNYTSTHRDQIWVYTW